MDNTPATQVEPADPKPLPVVPTLIAVVLIGVLGLAAYYAWGPCGRLTVNSQIRQMRGLSAEFTDALEIAGDTPRMLLAAPLQDLEKIQERAEDMQVTGCLIDARDHLAKSTYFGVEGMRAFQRDAGDATVNSLFNMGTDRIAALEAEFARVNACAPFCK